MTEKSFLRISSGAAGLIKFVVLLLLIPTLAALAIAFQKEIWNLKHVYQHALNAGVLYYVISNFFVYDFQGFYKFGQGMTSEIFRFWSLLSRVVGYVIPIYTIIVIALYYLVDRIFKIGTNDEMWFFLIGFTMAMHVVMTARELYEDDENTFKMNYLFAMALIFIAEVFLLVQCFNVLMLRY